MQLGRERATQQCCRAARLLLNAPGAPAEYCARGSLYDVLSAASRDASLAATLTWRRRIAMLLDAAAGLAYLHSRSPPIIHRDGEERPTAGVAC